jgi:hypothetical protein
MPSLSDDKLTSTDAQEPRQGRGGTSPLHEEGTSEGHQEPPRYDLHEGSTDSSAGRRKKYWVIAALLALLFLAREGGFVNWYLFQFNADSETQTLLHGIRHLQTGDYTETTNNTNSTYTTRAANWGLGFHLLGGSPLAVDLKEEIQNNLNKQTRVTAVVEEVQLAGPYWLPLLKRGSCKYRVRLQVVGEDSVVYTGVLNGVTNFYVSGVCSIRTFKQTLGAEIAAKAVKSVNNVTRR